MIAPFTKSAVLEILRTPAASDTFPDMIRRVEALEGSGVRIKALKWLDGYRPASTPHLYQIWPDNGGSGAPDDPLEIFDGFMLYSPNMMALGVHQTIESAKAAAQADYEARILAALEPVAHPETGPGELLPCPFCGGTDMYWPHGTDPAIIECGGKHGCGARSGVPEDQTEAEAIAAWNRRAAREPGTEPTPGQFTTMCLAIEDAIAEVARIRQNAEATNGVWQANLRLIAERDRLAAELAAAIAREAGLRDFIGDFANAKIDALRYQPSYGESPEDEPDPVVDAETVWAWQADAKAALSAAQPAGMAGKGE